MAGLGTGFGATVNMSAQANVFAYTGSSTIDPGSIDHNGNAPFDVMAGLTNRTISGAPDCTSGSGNWTEFIEDLAFTSAVISVF